MTAGRGTLLAIAAALALVVATLVAGLLWFANERSLPEAAAPPASPPAASATAQSAGAPALLGDVVRWGKARHVTSAAALEVTLGEPPAGGLHFAQPSSPGVYTGTIEDGNAIHALEHGIVWITYRADLVSASDLETLRAVARSRPNDVILSPRPRNAAAAAAVSWGRRLNLASPISRQVIEEFVARNVNQSPEPGVR
ncbi:MAG: DUF3105 domain-containing protein [Dehalococcoidia bacterium]|nr:DUF3105 domain-containing protein [Dehalococcoidia bacterium]